MTRPSLAPCQTCQKLLTFQEKFRKNLLYIFGGNLVTLKTCDFFILWGSDIIILAKPDNRIRDKYGKLKVTRLPRKKYRCLFRKKIKRDLKKLLTFTNIRGV
jgi:hypothetical protein